VGHNSLIYAATTSCATAIFVPENCATFDLNQFISHISYEKSKNIVISIKSRAVKSWDNIFLMNHIIFLYGVDGWRSLRERKTSQKNPSHKSYT
jgi:hypothetical protein